MNEQFHQDPPLSKDVLHPLMQRKNGPGLWLFAVQYSLLLGSAALVVWRAQAVWWQWFLPLLVFATMTMGMFAATHETGHNTAFRSRWLNALGSWLVTLPIFYVPTLFQHFHFAHHRHTHEPGKDPEITVAGQASPPITSSFLMYFSWLSGLPLLMFKTGLIVLAAIGAPRAFVWEQFFFYVPERARTRAIWEARAVLLFHLGVATIAYLWLPGLWLLLLGQWLGHAMLAFYLVFEHNGLPHEGTILQRTRTLYTSRWMCLLMWNMPYHAEHHAYPAIPWHNLPALHELWKDRVFWIQKGLPPLHKDIVSQLMRGEEFSEEARKAG